MILGHPLHTILFLVFSQGLRLEAPGSSSGSAASELDLLATFEPSGAPHEELQESGGEH